MSQSTDRNFLDFANKLANASGDVLLYYFQSNITTTKKTDLSPVTEADIAVETKIRAMIAEFFPDHGIVGEEFGNINPSSPYQWVIDPIDGTRSFIAGYPIFTTLIALLHNGKPLVGVIDQPVLNNRWAAIAGEKTFYNDSLLASYNNKINIENSNIATTSLSYFSENELFRFNILKEKSASVVYGGDGYAYAMLASGRLDIVLDASMKPYDFCALIPIIEGAGGAITDWQGKELNLDSDGSVVAAANKELHSKVIKFL